MTKNREEKKQQLKRTLEDYRAFDGNEKEIEGYYQLFNLQYTWKTV